MRRILPLALILAALPSSPCAADGDADDKAIRDLAGRFFDAYASKDLDAIMALWSEKSPDYEARKKTMAGLYAQTGPIGLKSMEVVRLRRDGGAASVRVRAELTGNDLKTGKLHPFLGRLDRVLDVAREGGEWKILRYTPSDRRLMERLVAAASKAERLRLLDQDSDLVGQGFVFLVLQEGKAQAKLGRFEQASGLLDLAQEVADGLGDVETLAYCHWFRGAVLELQSRYEPALASYQQALRLLHEVGNRPQEAVTLRNIGIIYRKTGRYAEALQQYRDGLAIDRELGDLEEEAGTLNSIGIIYEETSRYAEALQHFEESLAIHRKLGDAVAAAENLSNMGIVYRKTGRYAEALKQYQGCLAIDREQGRRRDEATDLNNIAVVYDSTGRYADALQQSRKSIAICRDLGDRDGEARALLNSGNVYWRQDRYADALQQYQDSLAIYRDIGSRHGVAAVLKSTGIVYRDMGRYADALQQYHDALGIFRDLGDRDGEATTLASTGEVYQDMGRYRDALKQFQDGFHIAHELGDREGEAQSRCSMGSVCLETGRYEEALQNYRAGLEVFRDLGDPAGEASVLDSIGHVYLNMGLYGEALRQHQDSLRIARERGIRSLEGASLNNIGVTYEYTNRHAEALRQYQAALEIARQVGNPAEEASCLNNIGRVYMLTGRHAEALRQHQAALEIYRRLGNPAGEADCVYSIGNVYYATGRSAEALQQYQDSRKIYRDLGDPSGEAGALIQIGRVCADAGRYEEARQRLMESLKIAETTGYRSAAVFAYFHIGYTYRAQKHWGEAADAFDQAVHGVELLRTGVRERSLQTTFLRDDTVVYSALAACRLELADPAGALAASERAKARGLLDILTGGKADPRRGMSDDERKQGQTLADAVTALGVQLEDLRSHKADVAVQTTTNEALGKARQDLEEFRRALYLHRPDLQSRRAEFAPASPEDLGRSLFHERPGLVVLSYLVGDDETLLFVLTAPDRDGGSCRLAVRRIDVSSKELAEAVEQFREGCSDPGKGEPDSDDLYRWLVAPADAELKGARQVIIVPDGVLHTLPFQALKGPDDRRLIERFAVSYAPSITALTKMETLGATRREQYAGRAPSVLAVGVSDFGRREKKLPAAQEEAKAVAEAFGNGGKLLSGAEATRARLESSWSGRRYLHFATHGRLDADAPLYSSLVLTPDQDEGTLYANDLLDADVPAELVVMSACHSGEGQHVAGEGLLGMSWAWFGAGVPSVVASQWSVGDASTARLMKVFYGRLAAGDSKAEALRQAETALLADPATRHPFYWAPFVLVGDDR